MKQNLATVTAINRDAVQTTRRQALADAEGISYLYFLSDALGPRLGKAFLTAYDQGALGKAAALIKASEVSTGEAKSTSIIRGRFWCRATPFTWCLTMWW